MKKQNRLVEASFYKKEGFYLWLMYYIFFSVGWLMGSGGDRFWEYSIFFIVMLFVVVIFGKEEAKKCQKKKK